MDKRRPYQVVPEWLVMAVASLLVVSLLAVSLPTSVHAAPAAKISCAFDYRVRKGDTLAKIASRYGVKPVDIVRVNKMHKPYSIFVGQRICIPNISKEGFKDIPKVNANALAGYFVVSWNPKGIKIQATNFPKKNNYYVKVDDLKDGIKKWIKLGTFRTTKKGSNSRIFKLPPELQGAVSLKVCLKNARTNSLTCNTLSKWADQSYAAIQQMR